MNYEEKEGTDIQSLRTNKNDSVASGNNFGLYVFLKTKKVSAKLRR